VRKFPLYSVLVDHPAAAAVRRRLVPKAVRNKVRAALCMSERPVLSETVRAQLQQTFDEDLATLGRWLGRDLNCRNFRAATGAQSLGWQ